MPTEAPPIVGEIARRNGAGRAVVESTAGAAAAPLCAHCRLPVPEGLVEADAERQFCCRACAAAYEIIHGCGLEAYYALRERTDDDGPRPSRGSGAAYEAFDDPAFASLYCANEPGGLVRATLRLDGVHCAACVWLVEALPRAHRGVVASRLDLARATVTVLYDASATRLSAVARTLDRLGYPPSPARGAGAAEARRREDRKLLVRIAVAGALAGNVMLVSIALYAGAFADMSAGHEAFFRWIGAGLTAVALAWPGSLFFRGAVASLRVRRLHLDLPIAVALAVGGAWGVVNAVRGAGEVYFDSITTVVFLLLIGRWVQRRSHRSAVEAVEMLYTVTPSSAMLVREGEAPVSVPVEALRAGDVVEVACGASAPADGVVTEGESSFDARLLTGESVPVRVGVGDAVSAGAVNLESPIRVRVERAGEETRVARLMRLVQESAERRAPIVRMADRIAGWFVAAALGLAGLTAGVWMFIDPARAVDHAAALLIVTCPCALGLATPLAVAVAIGRAARRGILIKGGDALERLAKPGVVFLDKTGTITQGRLALLHWEGDEDVKPLVAAVEAGSNHPIARALVEAFGTGAENAGHALIRPLRGHLLPEGEGASDVRATDVRATVGGGIEGTVGGRRVVVGSAEFVASRVGAAPRWAGALVSALAAQARTPVVVAVDGEVAAVAGLGDPVRPDAHDAVEALRKRGWTVGILSGDHPAVVAAVGSELGIPADLRLGGVSPEGKLAAVRGAMERGPVVMVGDGVNDSAALAAATVGIAVHGGVEASLDAADIALLRPGLGPIVEGVEGAGRTVRTIKRNLSASLLYNVVAVVLAMVGLLSPLVAAGLMPLSSLTVITLSRRARTFEREEA